MNPEEFMTKPDQRIPTIKKMMRVMSDEPLSYHMTIDFSSFNQTILGITLKVAATIL